MAGRIIKNWSTRARRRPWRHGLGRRYGRHGLGTYRLRRGLTVILAAELVCGVVVCARRMDIRLIRREEEYRAEWISPLEAFDGTEAGIKDGVEQEDFGGTVYGLRVCPETLEIQFYSRRQSVETH